MRDYTYEHQVRKARTKRILADIEREKAVLFLQRLQAKGLNYSTWLNEQINQVIKGDNVQ